MTVKIFGREPAVLLALVQGLLALLLSLDVIGLTAETSALWYAVASAGVGIYLAYVTRETLLAAATGGASAVMALLIAYGTPLNVDQQSAILGFIAIALGFVLRAQNAPLEHPTLKYEEVTV